LRAVGIRTATDNLLYTQRKEIEKAYNTYFRQGGLPELTQVQNKRPWLSNLFNKIFFGDLISRFQIRNDLALRVLVRKLAECVGQPASYTRLTNIVSSVGKKISVDTVIDYIRYMSDSWLILSFENICATLADKESNKKYYFIDNGILNLFLIDPYTALLENQVAVRLYQLYGDRVYYYQKNIEVDFFVYDIGLALQVSYSIQDHDTRERETNALIKLSNHLNVTDMLIITKDEEEVLEVNGKTIHVLPIWKWMMQPEEKKTF
jgi:predicted AAA+ superfamily ATPase